MVSKVVQSGFAHSVFALQVSIKHSEQQPTTEEWQPFQQAVLLWQPLTTTEVSPLSPCSPLSHQYTGTN